MSKGEKAYQFNQPCITNHKHTVKKELEVRKALDPNKRRPAPLPPPSQPPPPTLPTSVPNTQPGRGDLLNSIIHFDASTLTKRWRMEEVDDTQIDVS
ncbi:hypothetical protein ACTXT7_000194 [Hymenolepis weldensis]